eukprot:TRINITY_DN16534_c0_g1_i1.p1 TRINITY_DN16534_c0_g1~~TRINITY_DN16534_c0_g1_i1.p1  ORF type:complete len:489 (+),score=109.53 TRINITY_DN16534_c0_g1_i1:178-1467(+)
MAERLVQAATLRSPDVLAGSFSSSSSSSGSSLHRQEHQHLSSSRPPVTHESGVMLSAIPEASEGLEDDTCGSHHESRLGSVDHLQFPPGSSNATRQYSPLITRQASPPMRQPTPPQPPPPPPPPTTATETNAESEAPELPTLVPEDEFLDPSRSPLPVPIDSRVNSEASDSSPSRATREEPPAGMEQQPDPLEAASSSATTAAATPTEMTTTAVATASSSYAPEVSPHSVLEVEEPEVAGEEANEASTFDVAIDKTEGGNLGWDFDVLDKDRFIITCVWKGGLIDGWNSNAPEGKRVKPMDRLVMVNGEAGTIETLMYRLEGRRKFSLTLTRPRELHIVLRKHGNKPLGVSLGVDDFSMGILIMQIKEGGAFHAWNRENPSCQVSASDRVVAVNGREEAGRNLLQMISDSDELNLKLLSWPHDDIAVIS